MKNKSSVKRFKTTEEMDEYLENNDLGDLLRGKGVLKRGILKKINLDLPATVVDKVDQIANKIGIARQPLLKMWIHERLQKEESASTSS